jgi:hypothetical protein
MKKWFCNRWHLNDDKLWWYIVIFFFSYVTGRVIGKLIIFLLFWDEVLWMHKHCRLHEFAFLFLFFFGLFFFIWFSVVGFILLYTVRFNTCLQQLCLGACGQQLASCKYPNSSNFGSCAHGCGQQLIFWSGAKKIPKQNKKLEWS